MTQVVYTALLSMTKKDVARVSGDIGALEDVR
jgi:hypothetical protein